MNITSTNSVLLISVPAIAILLYQVQGFSADTGATSDNIDLTENLMSVDGFKSAGFLPPLTTMNISLQADSPSIQKFYDIYTYMLALKDIAIITAILQLPAIGYQYNLLNGTLTNFKPFPDMGRTLMPTDYSINFGISVPSPIL